ncbi:hypothetical protein RF11_13055 [Thelohanellus kitauei]|uniref:Uncharacterized protein n=1 Tax=Thelohanellus kitauei TaxID=669202 RepID=A0A0C2IWV7_THEKT|nr:hypothetical protein RF11_13055 [Thelohanellus kitauei]
MDVVVRCVNKISKSALNRLEFKQFLSDMNEEYGELLLHCEDRLLSKGKGNDKLYTNLCDEVYAFRMKLRLFIRQLTDGILYAFPTVKARLREKAFNVLQHEIKLESLLEAFESRFYEFEKDKDIVALFTNPFLFPESKTYHLHEFLQLEVIEL